MGKTVTMLFPRAVNLMVAPGELVRFPPGPNEVPAELAEHEYLKDNGVTKYEGKGADKAPEPPAPPVAPEAPLEDEELDPPSGGKAAKKK